MRLVVYNLMNIRSYMMRINIVLNDTLVQEAMRLSGAKTPKELILKALEN